MLGTQTPWLGRSSQSVYIYTYIYKFGYSTSKKENLAQVHPSDLTQCVFNLLQERQRESRIDSSSTCRLFSPID